MPSIPSRPVSARIPPVDGLRTVAVLGVVWIHVWMFCGNPAVHLHLGNYTSPDLERSVAIVGNGVNLFFVLSGFCMYWMYARRSLAAASEEIVFHRMIVNRWRRLAPAFYMASFLCAVGIGIGTGHFPFYDLLAHFAFLHLVLPRTGGLAAPFWSLSTEWQFYLLLPLFFLAVRRKLFWPMLGLSILLSVIFRGLLYWGKWMDPGNVGFYLAMHLDEFCWGMAVAFFCAQEVLPPSWLRGVGGFVFGGVVAYAGRMMMVTEVVAMAGKWGPFVRTLAEPVMTLGFGVILWNVISGETIFSRLLSRRPMQLIGRWSYSIYLLHWWPCVGLARLLTGHMGQNFFAQILVFALAVATLVPAGGIFYRCFEASYFQRKRIEPVPSAFAVANL